jgi:CheY-like chemotaxis protein
MTPKILVVENEIDILNILESNLIKAGFKVISASNGTEAIETAKREKPDLIILDIILPNIEGREVCKALKKNDATRHIPVIMVIAKGNEIDRLVDYEFSADDYISKPFSPMELILKVKGVMKKKMKRNIVLSVMILIPLSIILIYGVWYIFKLLAIKLDLPSNFFVPAIIVGTVGYILILTISYLKCYKLFNNREFSLSFTRLYAAEYASLLPREKDHIELEGILILAIGMILFAFIEFYLLYNKYFTGFVLSVIPLGMFIIFWLKKYRKSD